MKHSTKSNKVFSLLLMGTVADSDSWAVTIRGEDRPGKGEVFLPMVALHILQHSPSERLLGLCRSTRHLKQGWGWWAQAIQEGESSKEWSLLPLCLPGGAIWQQCTSPISLQTLGREYLNKQTQLQLYPNVKGFFSNVYCMLFLF